MATNVLDDLATAIRHGAFAPTTVIVVERTSPEPFFFRREPKQDIGVGFELVVQLPRGCQDGIHVCLLSCKIGGPNGKS